jgi:hypothetical protein
MACKNCECDKTDAPIPVKRDTLDLIDGIIKTIELLEKRVSAIDRFLSEKYSEVEGSCSYWLNKKEKRDEMIFRRDLLIEDLRQQGYTVTEP